MRQSRMLLSAFFLLATLCIAASDVYAINAALVVKDASNLSPIHEQPILQLLENYGFNVTLVDKNAVVDYHTFNLIVVAGRPLVPASEQLDSFVAGIPVNDIPTIAIDYRYPAQWGWTDASGMSSYSSNQAQHVFITQQHLLTWGYVVGESVNVQLLQGYDMIDMVDGYTNLKTVASASTVAKYGVIRYGDPGTVLNGGKSVSNNSAVVFFGIPYPLYWTQDAQKLFKNAVNWLVASRTQPTVGAVSVTPSYGTNAASTWHTFDLAVAVNDSSSGIDPASCEYTTDMSNWHAASYDQTNGLCYESNVTAAAGASLNINFMVKNNIGAVGEGNAVQRIVAERPLEIDVSGLQSQYSLGEAASLTGHVSYADNGQAVGGAAVTYAMLSNSSTTADQSGNFQLNINAPSSYGDYALNVSATSDYAQGSALFGIDVSSQAPQPSSSGTEIQDVAMDIAAPSNVAATQGSDLAFTATVENVGSATLHNVSVLLNSYMPYDVAPTITDIGYGSSQSFAVTVHVPGGALGNYTIRLWAISDEVSMYKDLNVSVSPAQAETTTTTTTTQPVAPSTTTTTIPVTTIQESVPITGMLVSALSDLRVDVVLLALSIASLVAVLRARSGMGAGNPFEAQFATPKAYARSPMSSYDAWARKHRSNSRS